MHKLVLLRHGESTWNRDNRFTGWTDVDLTERGMEEAHESGRLLWEGGLGQPDRLDRLVGLGQETALIGRRDVGQ